VRKELGRALTAYGAQNPQVVVLDADASCSTGTQSFAAAYPARFFNVGIAEPGMVDTAVGLALAGKVVFASAFAAVLAYRALEQIRTCVAYNRANVKLLGGFAGVSDFKDGPTHHAVFDLAVMRAMPGMTVVNPADGEELTELIPLVGEYPGPVYVRVSRADIPPYSGRGAPLVIGRGRRLGEGRDLTLAVSGVALHRVLRAREMLVERGVQARVLEFHTLKPLDEDLLLESAEVTGGIVAVEEHTVIGGLYGAICETLARKRPTPVVPVGLQDTYARTAPDPESLWDYCGLRPEDIAAAGEALLQRQ
jgi:transketolase